MFFMQLAAPINHPDNALTGARQAALAAAARASSCQLDPTNLSIQLDTLIKAASAVGRTVEIRLKRETKRPSAAAV